MNEQTTTTPAAESEEPKEPESGSGSEAGQEFLI
jgi:hypothetical protein